jgi:hypothetical protein
MTNQYTLVSYKLAIQREEKELNSQWEALKDNYEFREEDKPLMLKQRVKSYFSDILCEFDEQAYKEALKEVNSGDTVKSIFEV